MRRRREKTVAEVYDWAGLERVEEIRRLLEVAVVDTLGLDNSPARSRALAHLASLSLKALEVGETEQRLSALEEILEVWDTQRGRGKKR